MMEWLTSPQAYGGLAFLVAIGIVIALIADADRCARECRRWQRTEGAWRMAVGISRREHVGARRDDHGGDGAAGDTD